jgi:phosphatidylserine/phosphatidylglycerophosphate/cardiolipin synthase-like enzyme
MFTKSIKNKSTDYFPAQLFEDEIEKKNSLKALFQELDDKKNSTFSDLSYVHLSKLIPLNTNEMHIESKSLICSANSEVLMQFYKFHPDSDAGEIIIESLKLLKRKAERTKKIIQVKFIINQRGYLSETFYKKNEPTGLIELCKELQSDFFNLQYIPHRAEAFGSFHSKYIIVDSEKAMIRGTDIGKNDNYKNHRHESAMLVDKELAILLKKDFLKSWKKITQEDLLKNSQIYTTFFDGNSIPKEKKLDTIPCIFISKKESGNMFTKELGPLKMALLYMFSKARSHIQIITANLNDPDLCTALAEACNRGVTVQIVMGKYHNDKTEKKHGGTNADAMKKIVFETKNTKMNFLQIKWATDNHKKIVDSQEEFAVHTKYVCIDECVVLTGSSPLDKQAMYNSREADIIFNSKEKAKEFNAKFFTEKFLDGKDYFSDIWESLKNIMEEIITLLKKSENNVERNFSARLEKTFHESLFLYDPDMNEFKKIMNLEKEIQPLFTNPLFTNQDKIKTIYKKIKSHIQGRAGIKEENEQYIEFNSRRLC